MIMRWIVLLGAAIALCGCGTTNVGLKYEAPQSLTSAAPVEASIEVGSFIDQRGEPAQWLGAIRGGFGNPLKNLESDRPVAKLVEAAFADGLRARRFRVTEVAGQFQLTGVIKKLDCNQIVRREANVEIELSVIQPATGRQIFMRTYSANNLEGSLLSPKTGVFASVEDLRVLTERTLREVVDKALDDSAFRSALRP